MFRLIERTVVRSAHSFIRHFSTRRPLCHSGINLLSIPLAPHQLPSSPFTPSSTYCSSILLSSSSHWTFPRRSTPSDTPRCCPNWLNSTCQRLSTSGWYRLFSGHALAPYRVQWRRLTHDKHHRFTASIIQARALDGDQPEPVTMSQQAAANTKSNYTEK